MSKRELTPMQEMFLVHFFSTEECIGNAEEAALASGYTPGQGRVVARALKDEILLKAEEDLIFAAPKAVHGLVGLMEEENFQVAKADHKMKVVQDILDRVGVARKQDIGIMVTADTPMFFIPAKVTEDVIKQDDNES